MSKWIVIFLIGLFITAWFANSHVLLNLFPYSTQDEYYRFIQARNIVYEAMFLILIIAIYLSSKGIIKAMSCFAMILVLASVIDKVIFNITSFLYSDWILINVALIVSIVVYGRNK